MSAFRGKADALEDGRFGLLLAICGWLPVGKGFLDGDAEAEVVIETRSYSNLHLFK